jgi:2-dehydro-3-deoxyphosphogluconate aldolase / (4S)-4-hydroxy-2-oxoglutarate aldolase
MLKKRMVFCVYTVRSRCTTPSYITKSCGFPFMPSLFPSQIRTRIEATGVIAVLVIDDARHAVPLARALVAGGIDAMELTLRTPAALGALCAVTAQVPEMIAGVGTILTTEQVDQVADAGAAFGVSPGLNRRVVERANRRGLPFAPGIVTPSDIEAAIELGCRVLKFFPAEPSGGLPYLKSIYAPYAHLGVQFVPLGGVSAGNLAKYITDPSILAVGGSWLAPKNLLNAEDWTTITANARQARVLVDQTRKGIVV